MDEKWDGMNENWIDRIKPARGNEKGPDFFYYFRTERYFDTDNGLPGNNVNS